MHGNGIDGDQRARQPAGARAQRRLGAFVRRGGRSPRHRSLRERAGALRSAARRSHRSDRVPRRSPRRCVKPSPRPRCALAPKVSVVIDGGGRIGLDAVPADIRLRATPTSEGPETPCRTRRQCLKRDGSRRHRSSKTRSMPCWLCSRPSPPRGSRRAPPICCRRVTRPRRRTQARGLARQRRLGCIRSRTAHALSASGLPSAMPKPPP